MSTWKSIFKLSGSYESPVYKVGNNLNSYLSTIKEQAINPHNQELRYYFSVSFGDGQWTEWKEFFTHTQDLLDGYSLEGLLFKYKVALKSVSEAKKPYLQKLSIDLSPFANYKNLGDLPVKPKIWITKKNSSGTIKLINETTEQELIIKNLNKNEQVFIDCENEDIVSSAQNSGVYRYDDHNDEFLELAVGDNFIRAEGDLDFDIKFKYILLQD